MKVWRITYILTNGYQGSVDVDAVNRVMAYEVFKNIAKDFVIPVKEAQADLIEY